MDFCKYRKYTEICVHLVNIKPERTTAAQDTVKKCVANAPNISPTTRLRDWQKPVDRPPRNTKNTTVVSHNHSPPSNNTRPQNNKPATNDSSAGKGRSKDKGFSQSVSHMRSSYPSPTESEKTKPYFGSLDDVYDADAEAGRSRNVDQDLGKRERIPSSSGSVVKELATVNKDNKVPVQKGNVRMLDDDDEEEEDDDRGNHPRPTSPGQQCSDTDSQSDEDERKIGESGGEVKVGHTIKLVLFTCRGLNVNKTYIIDNVHGISVILSVARAFDHGATVL